jgi:hypothetical protein
MQVDNNRLYMLVTPICYSLFIILEANNDFKACGSRVRILFIYNIYLIKFIKTTFFLCVASYVYSARF